MIICVCRRVSDRDIAQAARNGCGSFDDLQIDLGVATCCGRCAECAQETLSRHQAEPLPTLAHSTPQRLYA